MKTNPESDGEYTDVEPEADTAKTAPAPPAGNDVEGEYTDSDTPDESNPQDAAPRG